MTTGTKTDNLKTPRLKIPEDVLARCPELRHASPAGREDPLEFEWMIACERTVDEAMKELRRAQGRLANAIREPHVGRRSAWLESIRETALYYGDESKHAEREPSETPHDRSLITQRRQLAEDCRWTYAWLTGRDPFEFLAKEKEAVAS